MVAIPKAAVTDTVPHVRKIGMADLRWALAEGWADFREKRGDIVLVGFIYPLVGFIAAWFALNGELTPLLFPLVAGLSLLGPTVATGFYELARRREQGLESSWTHFFDPWFGHSGRELVLATLTLALLFLAWVGTAWRLYQGSFGQSSGLTVSAFLTQMFTTTEGWQLVIFGNLVGLGFAILALATSVVTFPMLVDKPVHVGTAIATSFKATAHNPVTVGTWGLIVAALLVIGCMPLFVGLAVVLPVLGYATWHLYTRLVER
ncbi:Uncharacterized membrane protein [Sphingomonas laterariae]|uniref:Uncharacterized membrane protein n=1 Tax=Edaphosphingomonas laterariae TaxID=861865 RepID=A0A239EHW5_9SPHN|nr:DUF2189 domain-containing protein [Sphingomonas laterariae]SNS43484.1 Uncharacterized membrane protein [Sphingomonas laterariae]